MTDLLAKFDSLLREADNPAPVVAPFEVRNSITHKLTFHKGRARNFRSIGNEFMEIDYQRNQATLVTSDDNGAGKSTMLVWLLFFVLYNDTYSKKEKKAGLVNSQNKKDCVGEIEFSTRGSEWKVRRGIKPDFVEVHQKIDGQWMQVTNEAAKADMNKYIVNLIGVDQKMFENSLVLGKEKFIPFTEMYTADRRAMVETIWDLGFFSLMNEDVKAKIKSINTELDQVVNDFNLKMVDHTNKKTQLAQIEASNSLIQQQSADTLTQETERFKQVVEDMEELESERDSLADGIQNLMSRIEATRSDIMSGISGEVEDLRDNYNQAVERIEKELDAKVEDYQRIEVSAAKKALDDATTELEATLAQKDTIVSERNALLTTLTDVMNKQKKGNEFRIQFETEIAGHNSAIKRFHDMGVCPTCTQQVSEDTKAGVVLQYQPQITELEGKIAQLNAHLANIEQEIATHQERDRLLVDSLNEVEAKLVNSRSNILSIKNDITGLERDIRDFQSAAYNEKVSAEREMQAKIKALTEAAEQRVKDITKGLVESREQGEEALESVNGKIGEARRRKSSLEASIADLQRKLAVQPTPTADLEMVIAGIEQDMTNLEIKRQELDESLQDHTHLLYYLKDDQTKARIISLYLPFLNSKINEYLEALNMFLDIMVDDTFEITMSAAGRKGQSIFSLSTGQRARLNLAVTLALRDVANLKASVQCNLFVLDEILENMSERGVQESVEMLKHKFGSNNLFVISQREQEFQEYFQHNIRYGLRNGLTEIIKKD